MQKNILITGASRGIGFELVKILSKKHRVLAISRNTKPLDSLANCQALSIDISKSDDLKKVVDYIKNEWEQVDIIIHNAGKLINKAFAETTTQDFIDVYQVNDLISSTDNGGVNWIDAEETTTNLRSNFQNSQKTNKGNWYIMIGNKLLEINEE